MHASSILRIYLVPVLPAILGLQVTLAATLTVGQPNTPCPNPQYSTIGAAVAAAAPNDVIQICPALYAEQLVIAKPLTLEGITVNNVSRVLVQPATFSVSGTTVAAITIQNTSGVAIKNLVVDAGKNTVSGCTPTLATVHFLNASGTLAGDTIQGATLSDPQSCTDFFGNSYGALIETDGTQPGPFSVSVTGSSFHDFTRDGIMAQGANLSVDIEHNSFSGAGPASGSLQFSVFVANGPYASVKWNVMTEGNCGSLDIDDCMNLRSEGVVFRSAADGSIAEGNVITDAQYGIFLNGGNRYRVVDNSISNIDGGGSGLQIYENITNSLIGNNTVVNANLAAEGCGIFDADGFGNAGNQLTGNRVTDAYCGIAIPSTDFATGGVYLNTLYNVLDSSVFPASPPPPVEP